MGGSPGIERYVGSSVKGDACHDKPRSSSGQDRGDADRLLELSRRTQELLDAALSARIVEASESCCFRMSSAPKRGWG